MAGAGKVKFGVIVSSLFVLHYVAVSSGGICEPWEYCDDDMDEPSPTLLATCEAKLLQKEAQVSRTEAELAQTRAELAESRTELVLTQAQLAEIRIKLAQMESEMLAERAKNHTHLGEPSQKHPIVQNIPAEFNRSHVHLRSPVQVSELAGKMQRCCSCWKCHPRSCPQVRPTLKIFPSC